MTTFILLCFDKKAVVYSAKGESVQECRFRGNDTLSLEWGEERFAEVWAYFEDVYDISSWENTEFLIYSQDKKNVLGRDNLFDIVPQNLCGITVYNYNAVLFDLAKAKGLLTDNKAVLSWRNYTWKIENNQCALVQENSSKQLNDSDFVLFIAKMISVRNGESQNIVASLEAEIRQTEKLKEELDEVKAEYEQNLQKAEERHKKEILDLKKTHQNMLNKIKDDNLPYSEFIRSGQVALIHSNLYDEYIKMRKILAWIDICEQKISNYIAENGRKHKADRETLNLPIEPENSITLKEYKKLSSILKKIGFGKMDSTLKDSEKLFGIAWRFSAIAASALNNTNAEYSMAELKEDFRKFKSAVGELNKLSKWTDDLFFLLYLANNKGK